MEPRIKLKSMCLICEKTEHIDVHLEAWKSFNNRSVKLEHAFPDLDAQKRELVKASTRGHVYFCENDWPEDPDYPDYVVGGNDEDI